MKKDTVRNKSKLALLGAGVSFMALAPVPVQAADFGISLDVPFVRVKAHDGYYYHDNDHRHHYRYRTHRHDDRSSHYYYPSKWNRSSKTETYRHNPDGTVDHTTSKRYVSPSGKVYEWNDTHRHY